MTFYKRSCLLPVVLVSHMSLSLFAHISPVIPICCMCMYIIACFLNPSQAADLLGIHSILHHDSSLVSRFSSRRIRCGFRFLTWAGIWGIVVPPVLFFSVLLLLESVDVLSALLTTRFPEEGY